MITKTDGVHLKNAKEWALLSKCNRMKVGAVITQRGRAVSSGYNGTPAGLPNTCENEEDLTLPQVIHAERNAIYSAANEGIKLRGSTLYCTHSPCLGCAAAIIQTGMTRVVFSKLYRGGAGIKLLEEAGIIVDEASYGNY